MLLDLLAVVEDEHNVKTQSRNYQDNYPKKKSRTLKLRKNKQKSKKKWQKMQGRHEEKKDR